MAAKKDFSQHALSIVEQVTGDGPLIEKPPVPPAKPKGRARPKETAAVSTDGNKTSLEAVEDAFGAETDHARLIKIYGAPEGNEVLYSPAPYLRAEEVLPAGSPDAAHISTSHFERSNSTVRMGSAVSPT